MVSKCGNDKENGKILIKMPEHQIRKKNTCQNKIAMVAFASIVIITKLLTFKVTFCSTAPPPSPFPGRVGVRM